MTDMMSALSKRISVPEGVLFREIGGEAVLLELEAGKYFGLDEVGTRMWMLLRRHGILRPAYEALLDEYDVPEDRLRQDLMEFVDQLVGKELLKRHDE